MPDFIHLSQNQYENLFTAQLPQEDSFDEFQTFGVLEEEELPQLEDFEDDL